MSRIHSRRLSRAVTSIGAIAVAALALSGCEGTPAGTDQTSAAPGETATGLEAEVAALQQPLDSYPVPTEALSDVESLKGKTVFYVPFTQQSPQFAVTGAAFTEAMTRVGITPQICNGNGTPTDISACLTQATNGRAAAIVTDAISYKLAANAFDAARAADIPVIISNQIASDEHPADETLFYVPTPGATQMEAVAKWVAVDSNGEATVLLNQSVDGPTPAAFVSQAMPTWESDCPNCTVNINEVSSANFSLIPSSTSSALLKNSDTNYVISQFAQYLQPTQTGVDQAGATATVKGITGSAQLGALQQLAGSNFLYAATAQASAFQGWVDADAAMRMILGQELPEYTIPIRLFTRDNISSVTLTDAAEASGEWFGPTTFTDDFAQLWGVQ